MPIVTDRVAWSVSLSVSLSVTAVSPAKMTELIKMPFGLKIWDGPRKHVLDGGSDPPHCVRQEPSSPHKVTD